ncbi:DEAD/DEAH box helicase [Corynebacterium uropygiale]|uniref:DEAD/DEAH box helicase n=1 Tax=Corynebacterium uropygiale TaxID=1775911 RepID=A0A9X1TZS4_9CORY|nr:DEAD/DEAH box helicase [Corynebacterium uropygiale]MCF4007221.1 DEAD/DEAH box helicase [Corynebacterium uropygiale]
MSALNPAYTARHLARGLSEYVATSFSLAEAATAQQLREFLTSSESSMFSGPYIRTRLPFAPAEDWEGVLGHLPGYFRPYHHQAEAFRRLASERDGKARRPEPTLVVTGTGSGKTESFLFPILDHCARMRERGQFGVKALILYPMNALANDQERRLAELILEEPAYRKVRAAIYTGEQRASARTSVSEAGLITDRDTIRQASPDILLTNYKMLDQLLLRENDKHIWQKSAASLQYLVLDEFHTYDAAQGTDVAMLLRRLGLSVKAQLPEGFLSAEDQERPLGRITPVATSATLGGGGGQGAGDGVQDMLDFAYTIFGEKMDRSALVGETTLSLEQWVASIDELVGSRAKDTKMPSAEQVQKINAAITAAQKKGEDYEAAVHQVLCTELFDCKTDLESAIGAAAHNEVVKEILRTTATPCRLGDARDITQIDGAADPEDLPLYKKVLSLEVIRLNEGAIDFLVHLLTEIASLRARYGALHGWEGKRLPGVETQLWVRELSQVDRYVGNRADGHPFRWATQSDDTSAEEHWLPAIYCRHCGRSGWMLAAQPGDAGLVTDPQKIRRGSMSARSRQRPLIHASNEERAAEGTAEKADARFRWLDLEMPGLVRDEPSEEARERGGVVPVLTYPAEKAEELATQQTCPACGERDGIRYLGSSISTLLSVATANLFGMDELGEEEKKTLVFADSVQDAAHRAGFVQARARTFALRTRLRQALGEGPRSLPEITEAVLRAAEEDPRPERARYELLPPELAERTLFAPFWNGASPRSAAAKAAQKAARERLSLDIALEFGDRADLPRSLTSSGAASPYVHISEDELRETLQTLNLTEDPATRAWVHGILEYMRTQGSIEHPLLRSYIRHSCNPYLLNRREARARGVPAFPRGGTPRFPRLGGTRPSRDSWDGLLLPESRNSWFARWTRHVLGGSTHERARTVRELLQELAHQGVLHAIPAAHDDGIIYAIPAERVWVDVDAHPRALDAANSGFRLGVGGPAREALDGQPSFAAERPSEAGEDVERFHLEDIPTNYYRTLYESTHARGVVAKEHTSLLEDEQRREIEEEFKKDVEDQAANAPNVLVATPTLEMGIDIGSLSTVMLSSLPRSVANYVQRVGRAGRLSGNSLVMAFVRGRGASLLKLAEPLETIGGAVSAPAAYLSAREILHRQFLAYLIDSHPIPESIRPPQDAQSIFTDRGSTLLDLIAQWVEEGIAEELAAFRGTLAAHTPTDVLDELEHWATQELVPTLRAVRAQWRQQIIQLLERRRELDDAEATLRALVDTPAADDDTKEQYRSTRAAIRLVNKQLEDTRSSYWISALERYGLLPNFTLFDDAVEFDLSIARYTEADHLTHEVRSYERSSATALFEFAPGSTFYVQGVAAMVDSVEIGSHGEAITQWRLCPECSYSEVITGEERWAPDACPRCGCAEYGDVAQVIDVVEMTKVYASVDENRSAIDGSHDERATAVYQSMLSFDVPENVERNPWFLEGTGFGVEYLSSVELRWLNLGPRTHGPERRMAGQKVEAPLFRVCRHCGHIDSQAGSNDWRDHQRWCSHRHAAQEDSTTFALGRRMSTQGVLLHLPRSLVAADSSSLPSLIAAIRMGFKEHLGGDPSHLDVSEVRAPSAGTVTTMLLLHDAIPGGTGYLASFASPEDIRSMLEKTYRRLRASIDSGGPRAGVYRNCLLPFAHGLDTTEVSQESALATLTRILADQEHPGEDCEPLDSPWKERIVTQPHTSTESELEVRFRELLIDDLTEAGATITPSTSKNIRSWTISFPNSPHEWTMREQEEFGFTRPDYYFSTQSPDIRDIAVYLDGAAYHISEEHNRFAGDIDKRNRLYRDKNVLPWSITWEDTTVRQRVRRGEPIDPPLWYDAVLGSKLSLVQGITEHDMCLDPFTHLLELLQRPTDRWDKLAVCSFLFTSQRPPQLPSSIHAERRGENGLDLVLDTGASTVDPEAWRAFLHLTDHFYLSPEGKDYSIDIRVTGVGESAEPSAPEVGVETPETPEAQEPGDALPSEWQAALEDYAGDEDAEPILTELARRGHPAPTSLGEEIDGVMTIAGWEDGPTYLVYSEDSGAITRPGWRILAATPASIEELTA